MPEYVYNDRLARYQDARTGRIVKPPSVREACEAVIAGSAARLTRLAQQVTTGKISAADFEATMAAELKALHLAQLAAGRGGWAQLTPADFGSVGATLRTQYGYLARFAADIAAGTLSAAQIRARARLYAEGARSTYEAARLRSERAAGYLTERNVLSAAESCSGCLSAAGLGWVPIGFLPAVGTRNCKANCRCQIIRSKEAVHAA